MSLFADPTHSRRGSRTLLLASAAAGLAGLALLVSACGASGSAVAQLNSTTTRLGQPSPTSAGSGSQKAALAYARCMRSHGVPKFPDPDAQGQFPPFRTSVPKQLSAAADGACKHLLSRGGSAGTPQDRQEKLAFALAVARCLRSHGFPNFPDPAVSGQGVSENLSGAGIDSSSPQFQTAETTCEQQARGRP